MFTPYSITLAEEPGAESTIVLSPAFVSESWKPLHAAVREHVGAGRINWCLDIRELSLCDSIALGCIFMMRTMIRRQSGQLAVLIPVSGCVEHAFQLCGLDGLIEVRRAA